MCVFEKKIEQNVILVGKMLSNFWVMRVISKIKSLKFTNFPKRKAKTGEARTRSCSS